MFHSHTEGTNTMTTLPVDSTNGKRDLRLVSRLRTEITAALPGEDRLKGLIDLDCFILTQLFTEGSH